MKRLFLFLSLALLAAGSLGLTACKQKELKPVDAIITDPDRHYYPVIQGETLKLVYEIENPTDNTLVIQEVQTSCGCIVPTDELPLMILPKSTGRLKLGYESIKNTGYVKHQVYLYGNFTDSIYRQLNFDTHVVPPADYTRDYEQLYIESQTGTGSLRHLIDGSSSEKGYYTDHGDPRENQKDEIQEFFDEYAL